jgi:flagellar L-ring protein precursor FlgH
VRTLDKHQFILQIIFLLLTSFALLGCASFGQQWKKLVGGDSGDPAPKQQAAKSPTYNQQNNSLPTTYRQYKRTTKSDLENEAHLEGKAGSLWVMEGQGAYLFSQNIVRMVGDPIAVKLEGDPQEQLAAKSKVISKLLAQLEERRRRALGRGPASEDGKPADDKAAADKPAADKAKPGAPGQQAGAAADKPADGDAGKDFSVKLVPTRVVERMVDGNYRVRGTQPFMIGQREYKVIVSGIVRAEDFNEEGINSTQLLDSSFDIVSSKGAELRQ